MRHLAFVPLFVACSSPATAPPPVTPVQPQTPKSTLPDVAPTIDVTTLHDKTSVQALKPLEPGQFRIHMIDVGTGLAILIQGADFNFLYDGGSGDDYRGGKNSRLVAYLAAALGPSGGADCKPAGDAWDSWDAAASVKLDHVVQSHPHLDHGSLLDDVFACFDVATFWDSGVINQAAFMENLWSAVAKEPGVTIRTARSFWMSDE